MLVRIIRHEIRDVVRDGRFQIAAVVVAVLLAGAVVTGWIDQRAVAAEHASAESLARRTWLTQSAKDPHSAAHYGAYAFKPRGTLTLFDSGVNHYTGVAAWLEAHKQNEFQFRPAQDRSAMSRLGQLTAASTLQILIPVLIVLLAFTKFAGEREDGTLRQLVAAGVAPRVLAAGKALGVSAALALVLVPAAVVGAVALATGSGAGVSGSDGWRVFALSATYLLYFGVFIAAALAVSALAARPSQALALLIAFWVVNAVVMPRLASDVSRRLHPTPTAFELAQAVQADTYNGQTVHTYNVVRAADLRQRLLREYQVPRVEDLPVNFRGVDYLEREAHSNEVWDRAYSGVWSAFGRQVRIHHLAGLVAPLMAVRSLSMALAGADVFHHQHFAAAAESYRRRLVLTMNTALAYSAGSQKMGAYAAGTSLWSTVGPFTYRQPDLSWALRQVWTSAAALLFWSGLSIAVLWVSVRRVAV